MATEAADGAEGEVPQQAAPEEKPLELLTVDILPMIKDLQAQHGLRHGDYQRYRGYCSRRLMRLGHALKFTHGRHSKFLNKKVEVQHLTDARFLHIPLMKAERAWGYAMELKNLANTDQRKRHHLRRRLTKAAKHAEQLEALCASGRADGRSQLEAQAYLYFMQGSLAFELQDWKAAFDKFGKASTIYDKLGAASAPSLSPLYAQRVEEISPSMRYCAYNLGMDQQAADDLVGLRLKAASAGEADALAAKLDTVLSQTREGHAQSTIAEIQWLGKPVPVKSEKLKALLLKVQVSEKQLGQAEEAKRLAVYDQLFVDINDAVQAARDELKADASAKIRSQKSEANRAHTESVLAYLSFVRLDRTIDRNLVMIEGMRKRHAAGASQQSQSAQDADGKPVRADDIVRMYENLLQNVVDMQEITGLAEDVDMGKEFAARTLAFKAFRSFFLGESNLASRRLAEAVALYDRAATHARAATAHYAECTRGPRAKMLEAESKQLESLHAHIRGQKCAAQSYFAAGEEAREGVSDNVLQKPLYDRLDSFVYDPSLLGKKPNLVSFPPALEPVAVKPFVFDLALNHVAYPDFSSHVQHDAPATHADHAASETSADSEQPQAQQGAGIRGMIKGLWGWGKQ